MEIKALVFDFDGVITDTEPVHMEAWLAVFEPMGISFDEEEYRENYLGLNDRDFLDAVSRIHGRHFDDAE
ncbi:MAG TPA: HAD hydrolase-like protein, partial [bacterium]|nr:HAD hydrolase-like protein [bacterium]